MSTQTSTKVGDRQFEYLGDLLAKVALEFGRIIRANCVANAYIERPVGRDSASNVAHETHNTIVIAEHEARCCDAAVNCCSNDRDKPEHIGSGFHPSGKAATAYGITQVSEQREGSCLWNQSFNCRYRLLCTDTGLCTFGGENDKLSFTY